MPLSRPTVSRLALVALLAPAALHAQQTTAAASAAPGAQVAPTIASLEPGRVYTGQFLAGETDSLWARFTPQMKAAMKGNVATLKAFRSQVVAQLGTEKELLTEDVLPAPGDYSLYVRTVRMDKLPTQRFVIQWATTKDGTIGGFEVKPAPEAVASAFTDYVTKTPLQLPFEGEWYVGWGGKTIAQNYHAANAEQRFAYDFVIRRDGATHSGEGKALTDYYCFGQPIYAPGAGTIGKIVDGNPDNPPGVADPRNAAGNHVIIDHGNGEYSVIAHLQYASLKVKVGDVVKQGDLIAACGNSGNSSEPHLHYHLQNALAMFADSTKGYPALFEDYLADGKPVGKGMPIRGQTIARAPAATTPVAPVKPAPAKKKP